MASSLPQSPKPISPFFKTPAFPTTKPLVFLNFQTRLASKPLDVSVNLKKKKSVWLDPFDDGEDLNNEYGSLFADGKQEEDPRPPDNPDNPYGFLKFPMGYTVELASLPLKIRGDVRRCCCVVSGGVYENLLFFPTIQLLKDR